MKVYTLHLATRVNIRLCFWGLAMVTDAERDEWLDWFRVEMFPTSQEEYWFLTRHLWGNWWWIGSTGRSRLWRERPRDFRRFTGLIQIPKWELRALQDKANDTQAMRVAVANQCFDLMISKLDTIEGMTIKNRELEEYLKEWKSLMASQIVSRLK